MKIIHIYAMILFVGLLSLPLDGFANCDSAEAALTAAQDRLTTAREEFAQIVKDMMILLGGVSMSDVSNSDKPGGTTRSGIRKYLADKLKRMAEEAEDKVERAEMAVTSAQYSLEMCRMPDLAACGHPMPGHNRYQYSLVIMTIVATKRSTDCAVADVACVDGSSSSLKGTEKIRGIATRTAPQSVVMPSFFHGC